jgi:predicted DNA binding CopG/RHH family protein
MPQIRVSDPLYVAIKQQAEKEDRPIATIVRRAFDTYLALPFEAGKPPKKEEVAA